MKNLTEPPQKFSFVSDETELEHFKIHKSNVQKGQEKLHWYRFVKSIHKTGMETAFTLEDLNRLLELKSIIIHDGGNETEKVCKNI